MSNDRQIAQPPQWLATLRDTIAEAVKPGDLKEIIEKQVEKAKAGDARAAKFVLDQLGGNFKGATFVQNTFEVTTPAATPESVANDALADLRSKTYALIDALGPLTPGQIAANLCADQGDVEAAVEHAWFVKGNGGAYSLSPKYRVVG